MDAGLANHELRLLFRETAAGCNLECIYCRRHVVSKELIENDRTTNEAFQFVRHLAEFVKPIHFFSDGEPLFLSDIFQIATCASDLRYGRRAHRASLQPQIISDLITEHRQAFRSDHTKDGGASPDSKSLRLHNRTGLMVTNSAGVRAETTGIVNRQSDNSLAVQFAGRESTEPNEIRRRKR